MAISYGVYDSRALAMGGLSTSVGNRAQEVFYNPSLLAFHCKEKRPGAMAGSIYPALWYRFPMLQKRR